MGDLEKAREGITRLTSPTSAMYLSADRVMVRAWMITLLARGVLGLVVGWGDPAVTGTASAGGFVLPTGTVAFLLTDVEASTQRWEAEPDAMAAAMERHDAILDRGGVSPWWRASARAGRGRLDRGRVLAGVGCGARCGRGTASVDG